MANGMTRLKMSKKTKPQKATMPMKKKEMPMKPMMKMKGYQK